MVVKYVNVCDRCGEEWSQMDEDAPDLKSKMVRGHGYKDLCPSCLVEFEAMEDTINRLEMTILDEIENQWFTQSKIPRSIKVSLFLPAEDVPYREYEELFVKG